MADPADTPADPAPAATTTEPAATEPAATEPAATDWSTATRAERLAEASRRWSEWARTATSDDPPDDLLADLAMPGSYFQKDADTPTDPAPASAADPASAPAAEQTSAVDQPKA